VFRTLIVDDEPIARRVLRDELATYSNIEIVAEALDGVSAGLIQKLTPDLIFLDLQMPRMMGWLDVIQAVRSTTTTIVRSAWVNPVLSTSTV